MRCRTRTFPYGFLLIALGVLGWGLGIAQCCRADVKSNAFQPVVVSSNVFAAQYDGEVGGVWGGGVHSNDLSLTIGLDGSVVGTCGAIHDSNGDSLAGPVSGTVSSSGVATMTTASSDPITFTGAFDWADDSLQGSGTFSDTLGDTGTWTVYDQFFPSLTILDGNYLFSHANLSDSNLGAIGTSQIATIATTDTQQCDIAVADGATKLLLEYTAPTFGTVDFAETQGFPGSTEVLETLNGSTDTSAVPTQLVNGQNVAFAIYKTPDTLASVYSGLANPVEFQASFQPTGYTPSSFQPFPDLTLYEPPVILMHGFASGPSTWLNGTGAGPLYSLLQLGFEVHKVDYADTSLASFATNQFVLLTNPGGIQQTLASYRNHDVAITKVDVVGHSMGGILTRELAMWHSYNNVYNFNSGYVRRLITIGTPHLGSKAATYLVNMASGPAGNLAITALQKLGFTYGSAFTDLMYDSPAIQAIAATPIPSFAIAGISAFPSTEPTLNAVYGVLSLYSVANQGAFVTPSVVFPGESSDLIVGSSSATGGLIAPYVYETTTSTDHIQEPSQAEIGNEVASLLLGPATAFDSQGFPAPSSVTLIGSNTVTSAPSTASASHVSAPSSPFLTISSPNSAQLFRPGATVTVTLTPVQGATLSEAVISIGPPNQIIAAHFIASSPFTVTFTIPTNYVGDLPINVLASDSAGEICAVSTDCSVETTASVTSLTAAAPTDAFTTQNATSQLAVTGLFSDSVSRDITQSATGTTYMSSDTTVVSVSGNGLVTAVGNGTAQINVTNGIATGAVTFTVAIDTPAVLMVSPATGVVGASVALSLDGYSLGGATAVQFYLNGVPDTNITLTNVVAGTGGSTISATATIGQDAVPGLRTLVVTTGVGNSDMLAAPSVAGFTIQAPGSATHFSVSAPGAAAVGTPFNFTVTALDGNGNVATAYAGTIRFTSTDGEAALASDTGLANGVGTFSATLNMPGNRTITATDTASSDITGTSGPIDVANATLHTFPAGLTMFCVPTDYSGQTLAAVLGYASPRLAVWDATTSAYAVTPTVPANSLAVGRGYWVRFSQAIGLTAIGQAPPTNTPFIIALNAGWNMIGCPQTSAVAISSLGVTDSLNVSHTFADAVANELVGGTLFTYQATDVAYESLPSATSSLTPYEGYWLFANHSCTLSFPVLNP